MVGAQRHGHQRERWDAVRQAWEATTVGGYCRRLGGEEAEGGPTG